MDISALTNKHYSALITKDVAAICEPLKQYGIIHFSYTRFFHDHSAYTLTNYWDSYYYHCKKQYPISSPISEQVLSNKFHFIPFLNTPNMRQNPRPDYQAMFNLDYPIYFIEHYQNCTDLFIFGTTVDNYEIINFYLNHLDILENFKFYLKDKAKKLIEKSNNHRIIVPHSMIACFTDHKNIPPSNSDKKLVTNPLIAKHYNLYINHKEVSITKREFDVLKSLANGNSVKEAAISTQLSPRTVESYLANIRTKIGIHKKSEIIALLQKAGLL